MKKITVLLLSLMVVAALQAQIIHTNLDTLDFGTLRNGYEVSDTFEILVTNIGSLDLLITGVSTGPEVFKAYPDYAGIDPGESETFTVIFTPVALGDYSGILTFTSNDPSATEYTVVLTGHYLMPSEISVSPQSISAVLYSGKTTTQSFSINNTGGSNLDFTITPGEGSYALDFDGVDDYLVIPDDVSLQLTNDFTVEAWGYLRSILYSGIDHVPIIWRGNYICCSNDYNFRIATADNGRYTIGVGGQNGGEYYWFGGMIITNQWYHFTLVSEGDSIFTYLDGELIGGVFANPPYNVSGYSTYVGWANRGIDLYIDAIIDDIRMWNIARTQDEIQQDMDHELFGNEPGLVGYWNFNEGTGSKVFDKSPNGNDGTLMNGLTWTESSAPIIPSWLSVSPDEGKIPANSLQDIEVIFDASNHTSGDYSTTIKVSNNDPLNPVIEIPVTLQVIDAPSIHTEQDTLDFGILHIGYDESDTLQLKVSNTGSLNLLVSNITITPDDFSIYPASDSINPGDDCSFTVIFSPDQEGNYTGTITVNSNDPLQPQCNVILKGQYLMPPEISVNPQSISAVLCSGKTTTKSFTINNTGGSNLDFTITPGEGIENYALEFDGVDDYIYIPTLAPINNVSISQFTFESWVYFEVLNNSVQQIIESNTLYGEILVELQSNRVCFRIEDYNGIWHQVFSSPLAPSVWLHIACTYDGNLQKIYINGIEEDSEAWSGTFTISSFLVCGIDNNLYVQPLNGFIDEMRIWNDVRTLQDIQLDMTQELTGNEPGLAGYWNFDEGTGSNVFDKSPNGNNWNLMNGVTWSESSATIIPSWLSINPDESAIPANSFLDIDVIFDASDLIVGDYSTIITVSNNDPVNPIIEIPFTLQVMDAPSFHAELETLDFGTVLPGYLDTLEVIVENNGSLDLLIFSAETEPDVYSVFPPYASIDPGETKKFIVTYSPQSEGTYPGTLVFTCNDPVTPIISIPVRMVVSHNVGIEDPEVNTKQFEFRIYPNPAYEIINIENSNTGGQDIEIELLTVTGQVVYRKDYHNDYGHFTEQIDISGYAKGVYFLRIRLADAVFNGKIVVQ